MNSAGVLLVDKPEGITSAGVVATVKRRLGLKKVGHGGTLDPFATGLLVVLCEEATRLNQYLSNDVKEYSGIIRLGVTADTDDSTGTITTVSDRIISLQEVRDAAKAFIGVIQQLPPQFSAKKIDGVRAYSQARQGKTIELAPCAIEIISFEITKEVSPNHFEFFLVCGPGTYVRSLARDLGATLQVGGLLQTLRREAARPFSLKQAVLLEEIDVSGILPWSQVFSRLPFLDVTSRVIEAFSIGDIRIWKDATFKEQLSSIQDSRVLIGQNGSAFGLLGKTTEGWERLFWVAGAT